tara:strand:+ start:1593 stop:2519 length:927 start_codon:yes stop_codon:yes gene_type:complete
MTETITPRDEAHWLEMRDKVITSTGVSALFGMSPYLTRFELYHHHANGIKVPFVSNDRVEKGNRMEQYAAEEVGRQEGWEVEPFKDFAQDAVLRIGSSFDYTAATPDGKAILEIKAVDFIRHRDLWVDDQAPEHIEIQLQWQMMISGIHVGYIAAFTSVYEFHIYRREYDPEMGAAMLAAVAEFWADVDAGREPDPDFARDQDVIAAMFRQLRPDPANFTEDDTLDEVITRFERYNETKKESEKLAKAAKAEIHYMLGEHSEAFGQRYRIKAGWTKDTADRITAPDEVIKGRKGYRRCDFKELTPDVN